MTSYHIDPTVFSNDVQKVEYPQEYYKYKQESDRFSYINTDMLKYINPSVASDYRTAAILIALEKQNELINEQNALLKNLTAMRYHCAMDNQGSYRPYICSPI